MPFKTRRQKEAAAQRRYTFGSLGTISYTSAVENKPVLGEDKGRTRTSAKSGSGDVKKIGEIVYVSEDLLKTMFSASLLILAQISLRLTLA